MKNKTLITKQTAISRANKIVAYLASKEIKLFPKRQGEEEKGRGIPIW